MMELRKTELAWVRRPQQTRSQETLERLLDAAEHLLETQSFEEISVAAIAREAGSSVGSFYARFTDKRSLLCLLQERLYEEGRLTGEAALAPDLWADVPLAEVIRQVVIFIARSYRERQGLRRAILTRMAADATFRARAAQLAEQSEAQILALVAARRSEIGHADPRVAVDVCHRIVFGALDQNLMFAEAPPAGHALDDDVLAEELARMCIAYLGIQSKRAPAKKKRRKKKR